MLVEVSEDIFKKYMKCLILYVTAFEKLALVTIKLSRFDIEERVEISIALKHSWPSNK